jgi:uncharacterized protein YaiL (DUF2058 family)
VQNLRDQLLKAGLITEDQKSKAETKLDKRSKPQRRDEPRRGNGQNGQHAQNGDKPAQAQQAQQGQQPQQAQQPQQQKPSKKQLAKQPMNRMLDLSDPKTLKILQAIEANRVREDTKGDIAFHFTLRDGRVRKIFVNQSTSEGLAAGRMAIVEDGEAGRHVIVEVSAVSLIREADAEAVRFVNS